MTCKRIGWLFFALSTFSYFAFCNADDNSFIRICSYEQYAICLLELESMANNFCEQANIEALPKNIELLYILASSDLNVSMPLSAFNANGELVNNK